MAFPRARREPLRRPKDSRGDDAPSSKRRHARCTTEIEMRDEIDRAGNFV